MSKEMGNSNGLKKLGIGFIADKTPFGIEEAKFMVMKSILLTMIMADAIKIEVEESDGETIVKGYTFVEENLPEVSCDDSHRIDYSAIQEAKEKYPFLDVILNSQFNPSKKQL